MIHTHVCMFAIYKYIISYAYCVYHVMHMLNTYRHLDMPNFSTADVTLDRWRRWLHCRPSTLAPETKKHFASLHGSWRSWRSCRSFRTRWRKESSWCPSLPSPGDRKPRKRYIRPFQPHLHPLVSWAVDIPFLPGLYLWVANSSNGSVS